MTTIKNQYNRVMIIIRGRLSDMLIIQVTRASTKLTTARNPRESQVYDLKTDIAYTKSFNTGKMILK